MSKVFLDTGFLDDGATLEPVSLALVTEYGTRSRVRALWPVGNARRMCSLVRSGHWVTW